MTTPTTIGPPQSDGDCERYAQLCVDAFGAPLEAIRRADDLVGREHIRVVRRGEQVIAGLIAIPLGQYWGGAAVPMNGIGGVATAVEARGSGAATELLRAVVRELRERGVPISTLYPATRKLYRRVGYEMAGIECDAELRCDGIDIRDRGLTMRPATDEDEAGVVSAYRTWARRHSGNLERSAYHWDRVRRRRDKTYDGYIIEGDHGIEGYVYIGAVDVPNAPAEVHASDVVALTPAAARRILTFFADYRTTRGAAKWRTSPTDPLLAQLPEGRFKLHMWGGWMLRILDVAGALAARGYGPGIDAELHLRVHDDLLAENNGDYVLRVTEGRATAEPGGRGLLELDVRGLASLYASHSTPIDLVMTGQATGDEQSLALAATIFAGPAAWMRDTF